MSGTESVSSGPLRPGSQSCELLDSIDNSTTLCLTPTVALPVALVPDTSQFFPSDDSFAGRITNSRARPSLMSGKYNYIGN